MNLLLVQTSFLGDTILTTPVITALRELHPGASITTLTTRQSAEILRHDPHIQSAMIFDKRGADAGAGGLLKLSAVLRSLQFDRAYGLQRSLRTGALLALAGISERIGFSEAHGTWLYHRTVPRRGYAHEVERNLAILGKEVAERADRYALRVVEPPAAVLSETVRRITQSAQRYVVMVPGSVWATKRGAIEHYSEVARSLARRGLPVVLVGAPNEQELCAQLARIEGIEDLCGQTTISDMVALVAHAAAVMCNDSMALHLASAFRKPTLVFFCSTVPAFGFGPWQNPLARILEVPTLACRPCGRHGRRSCPLGSEHCMRGVPPHQALEAFVEIGVLA